MHPQVSVRADGKIALAPTGDIVELAGIGDGPPLGWFENGGFTKFQFEVTSRDRAPAVQALKFSFLRIGVQGK
jgi:hypothetical protein